MMRSHLFLCHLLVKLFPLLTIHDIMEDADVERLGNYYFYDGCAKAGNAERALQQVANKYVREILNCLATVEVIHVSTNKEGALVYHIQEEDKQVFSSPSLSFISFRPMLVAAYEPVKSCLPVSGPSCARYTETTHGAVVEYTSFYLERNIYLTINTVDGLKERLEKGIDVIEFGSGKGKMISRLAQMFPKSSFTATEVSPFLMEELKAALGHIPNIKFEMKDLCAPSDTPKKQYDLAFCTYVIHDLPSPLQGLKRIYNLVKKPDGIFLMFDISTSGSPVDDKGKLRVGSIYAVSTFMCLPESYQREDNEALGAGWGKQTAINLATKAGFTVQAVDLPEFHGLFICRP